MKKIRVKFVDFWKDFEEENNLICKILKKRYEVEISDNPEYLFYSVFGTEYLNYSCIRIFWTGESICPDFNICDYAIGYDEMIFKDRYLRYPLYLANGALGKAVEKHNFNECNLAEKTGFCNFVYSNANAEPFRAKLYDALNQYQTIDSGGRYKNNIGYAVPDKIKFCRKYKFTIACENSEYRGYSTEKILEAFAAQTIPIYWGNPDIEKEFNIKSFINCYNYHSIEDIVKDVIKIDQDQELYLKMMKEPAFKIDIKEKQKELEEFLFHIIEQPYRKCCRRNQSFWGIRYEDDLRMKNVILQSRFLRIARKIIPVKIKKELIEWKRSSMKGIKHKGGGKS